MAFIQDFFLGGGGGEGLACISTPKLGGSGGMLPQENFDIYNF